MMKTCVFLFLSCAALVMNAGCSSAPKGRVVETETGRVAIASAKDEPDARMTALDQAISYCSMKNQKPIFREEELRNKSNGKLHLNLKNLPVIGQVFKSENRTQVILEFRCNGSERLT
jgi:hypothetical protein